MSEMTAGGTDRHDAPTSAATTPAPTPPTPTTPVTPLSVYVHIRSAPRADYCAFATWTDREHLVGDYARQCIEIERAFVDERRRAVSVFVWRHALAVPAAALVDVLSATALADGAEVTVEYNPDNVDEALVARVRRRRGQSHQPRRAVDGAACSGCSADITTPTACARPSRRFAVSDSPRSTST